MGCLFETAKRNTQIREIQYNDTNCKDIYNDRRQTKVATIDSASNKTTTTIRITNSNCSGTVATTKEFIGDDQTDDNKANTKLPGFLLALSVNQDQQQQQQQLQKIIDSTKFHMSCFAYFPSHCLNHRSSSSTSNNCSICSRNSSSTENSSSNIILRTITTTTKDTGGCTSYCSCSWNKNLYFQQIDRNTSSHSQATRTFISLPTQSYNIHESLRYAGNYIAKRLLTASSSIITNINNYNNNKLASQHNCDRRNQRFHHPRHHSQHLRHHHQWKLNNNLRIQQNLKNCIINRSNNYNSKIHHLHHHRQQHQHDLQGDQHDDKDDQYSSSYTYSYNSIRNSIGLYVASSVILFLCYLTTTTAAAVIDHPIFDESSSDKEILDHLLQKSRYDKRLLPPVNDEDFCCGLSSPDMAKNQSTMRPHNRGTLTVNVNVLLLSLASPDESSLKYEVEFLLNQQWNDPRLQYGNKSQYEYLNALHHHDNIWTPDTYFIMHGDFKDPIIPMHFALRIYRNGTITYAMRRHLILSCQGSLHIFPFDDPKCSFSMESISYEFPQIKYVWKNDEDTLRKSPSLTTLNAYLIQNATVLCSVKSWRGNYSCLKVDLIFTRDRAFYFTTVFIPGIILVTSSFITFWLEWNAVPARSMIGNYSCLKVELMFTRDRAFYFTTVFIPGIILVTSSFITFWLEWNAVPARVMIGVTTMLNFFTTSNGFRSTLPVVSNLTAMNVWDGVCMCFIYASLLEFVCVNYVGRKRPLHNVVYRPGENPVTQRLPAVLSRIGVILASPLEIIEREYHAALSSEKAAAGNSNLQSAGLPRRVGSLHERRQGFSGPSGMGSSSTSAPIRIPPQQQHYHHQSYDYHQQERINVEPVYAETAIVEAAGIDSNEYATNPNNTSDITSPTNQTATGPYVRQLRSSSTNTPPLITVSGKTKVDIHLRDKADGDIEMAERQLPVKPPRQKSSRSTTPSGINGVDLGQGQNDGNYAGNCPSSTTGSTDVNRHFGEKKRGDTGGPNEIVACTNCGGGSSPCTHSANNGCATETCFVQVRKKEPPHPIRVAKTIDVIARITFPTAYSIFLIFFFVHYKGFS